MKSLKQNGMWRSVVITMALVAGHASAQKITMQNAQAATAPEREIVVSLQDHKLALVEDGRVIHVYRVAVGKPSTPSPVGTFTIRHRVADPTYYHRGKVIPPGPGNPVGDRWMSLSIPGYGIHGTNEPHSIGKAASHGCIRLGRRDIEDLFNRVRVGDKVVFIAQRDEETAQIFGDGPAPIAPARQPVLLVKAEPLEPAPLTAQLVKVDAPQPVMVNETAAVPASDNDRLMARNSSALAAGISAAGSR
jgi:L,D-transpeptidase catalytic domain